MDTLLNASKDKQEYILKQYESNVENMRRENLNELQSIKHNLSTSLQEVQNNYNILKDR